MLPGQYMGTSRTSPPQWSKKLSDDRRLLTLGRAAEILDVSRQGLLTAVNRGDLRSVTIEGAKGSLVHAVDYVDVCAWTPDREMQRRGRGVD